jgi:Bacterial Ig-like domain (group 2)/Bacterial Ig domain
MARIAQVIALLAVIDGENVPLFAQPTLRITAPAAGTVLNPGQSVRVVVDATGGLFKSVTIIAPGSLSGNPSLTIPPYQFSFTVPSLPSRGITPGPNRITAVGNTGSGPVHAVVSIDIERADTPQSIATDSSQVELSIGERVPLELYGTYTDGSVVRLTTSAQTSYASRNPTIAVVSADGFVKAVAYGSATIAVRHREYERLVRVNVIRNPN